MNGCNIDILLGLGYEGVIVFENPSYDTAIIGVSTDNQVIYSYSKMIEFLVSKESMSVQEAEEFIEYNTIRALPYAGESHPIIVYYIEDKDF